MIGREDSIRIVQGYPVRTLPKIPKFQHNRTNRCMNMATEYEHNYTNIIDVYSCIECTGKGLKINQFNTKKSIPFLVQSNCKFVGVENN